MFVDDLITRADLWIDNNMSVLEKVEVISNLENEFFSNNAVSYKSALIDLVAEQDTYSLDTEDFTFDSIQKLVIGDIEYLKMNLKDNYIYTYYEKNGDLVVDPEPVVSKTDGMEVIYLYQPTEKTVDTAETDTLDIVAEFGARWTDLYLYTLLNKYCIYNRDFDLANNYAMYYNAEEAKLFKYIAENRLTTVAEIRKHPKVWR